MTDEANLDQAAPAPPLPPSSPATPEPAATPGPAATPAADLASCWLCNAEVERKTTHLVNGQTACAPCVAKVYAELADQVPAGKNIAIAAVYGLVGALVGAAVWVGVAVVTDFEVGYIAVLVGFLAGYGVKLGAGKQRGLTLQYLAAGLSVVGLIAAKYMSFAYVAVKMLHERGLEVGYLSGKLLSVFPTALGEMLGPFDVLFLILSLGAAFRVPKPHPVSIVKV